MNDPVVSIALFSLADEEEEEEEKLNVRSPNGKSGSSLPCFYDLVFTLCKYADAAYKQL